MRSLISLAAVCVVSPAFAQDAAPAAVDVPVSEETLPEEGAEAVGTPVVAPPEVADTSALTAQIADLQARMVGLESVLADQRHDLTEVRLELLKQPDLRFELEGEYRSRGYVFHNLFEGQTRDARFMDHYLRVQPALNYRDLAKFKMELRGLNDVVWGDNQSLAATSLFANGPSSTNIEGQPQPTLELSRAWMEFSVPVGLLRVGRQPSHWGLGALANSGDGFDDAFGDNHHQTTFDRVMFATKPIAIAQTVMGRPQTDIPLFLAVGVDRLVEDPLTQYYGFTCSPGIADTDERYDVRCDANGDGLTDLDHGNTNDARTPDQRGSDWWADQNDDVGEMVYALIYKGEDLAYLGGHGDFTVGTYVVQRFQRESDSHVIIPDFYLDAHVDSWHLAFEGLGVFGQTRAITLPGAVNVGGDDPLQKTAAITSYLARFGYERPGWTATLEHGFASGDDNVSDVRFTGRPMAPDLRVGLLLYPEIVSRVTSGLWTDDARGLWSNGGVYNSRYFFPMVTYSPLDNWNLQAAFLAAMPHKPDGRFIKCAPGDNVDCAQTDASSPLIGWETDFALKIRFHEHVLFSLESGYAHATDRLPLTSVGLNPTGNFFTFQSRIGFEF